MNGIRPCAAGPHDHTALSLDQAIAEIEDGLGRRYDAGVGAACLELLREPGFTLLGD